MGLRQAVLTTEPCSWTGECVVLLVAELEQQAQMRHSIEPSPTAGTKQWPKSEGPGPATDEVCSQVSPYQDIAELCASLLPVPMGLRVGSVHTYWQGGWLDAGPAFLGTNVGQFWWTRRSTRGRQAG